MMIFLIQSYDVIYLVSLSHLVSHRKLRCESGKESGFGVGGRFCRSGGSTAGMTGIASTRSK